MSDILANNQQIHAIENNIYIFIHHQDGSTVGIRRLNKIYNLTTKQRMKQSSPIPRRIMPSK